MSLNVLLFDDEELRTEEWQTGLEELLGDAVVIVRMASDALRRELQALETRRVDARSGKMVDELSGTAFDAADLLIVDYDLFGLDTHYVVTGETVAYLARCFSACGLIVGVNQDATEKHFDLTLANHPRSYADVSIGSAHLVNKGLWLQQADAFRPWSWPIVPTAVEEYDACVQRMRAADADEDLLEIVGLAPIRSTMPRDCAEWLQPRGGGETPTSLENALHKSPIGLRPKEKLAHPDSRARVVAARARKWLESVVLPRQDVLVDAPHLALRLPGLLAGPPSEWSEWQRTTALHVGHGDVGLDAGILSAHVVQSNGWMSRPTWSWSGIASDPSLDALQDAPTDALREAVFCEDTSRFHARDDCRRFVAEVGGPLAQRWVRIPRDEPGQPFASYAPAVRFAL